MRQLTVDAGVNPKMYDSIILIEEDVPLKEIESLCSWLQAVFEGPYARLEKTWKIHPIQRWSYYFLIGEELTEIRLLQQHRRKVYEEWKKPYHIDGYKKRIKKVSVQS